MKGKLHLDTGERVGPLCVCACGLLMPPQRTSNVEPDVSCALCRTAARVERQEAPTPPKGFISVRPGCRVPAQLEAEKPRPLWYSWRSALRDYVRWVDDGAPLRSTSDVERTPGASGPPQGDKAQRQAERFVVVGVALAHACHNVAEIMAAVVWRIAGRPVMRHATSSTGEVRPKSSVRHRVDCDDEFIAEGTGILAGSVEQIVRVAGRLMEGLLYDRGLLAVRDEWLEDDMRLRGWKQIADHLNLSQDTVARAREWDPPIPVQYLGNSVFAETLELDAWIKLKPRPRSKAVNDG